MERQLKPQIIKDLDRKIVLLVGPRQVGKSWLAKEIGLSFQNPVYLSYDNLQDREIMLGEAWREKTDLLILDELHKMPEWTNYLKGIHDTHGPQLHILVTGSARLDMLRYSGDTLPGRFFRHRLAPFSLREIASTAYAGDVDRLLERGGFPEPFLSEEAVDAARWRQQYTDGLVRTDVFEVDKVHNLKALQLVLELLRRRVGSPVSFSSIARDIGSSPTTVLRYVQILELLYIVFRVTPYARNIARSLLKEPKIYFFDTGLVVGDTGARWENFVAVSLLKHLWALGDLRGENWTLNYLRTRDGEEVDFCTVKDDGIDAAVEVKTSDNRPSDGLRYFCERYHLRGVQVVKELRHETRAGAIEVRRARSYLEELSA